MDLPATPRSRRGVNWSALLPDVLAMILLSLSPQELLAVRGVCSSWRAVAKKIPCRVSDLPIRLMVRRAAPKGPEAVFHFFSLSGRQLLDLQVSDAELGWFRCCGHHDGWLALVSDEGPAMLLLNPVTDARVRLPPCSEVPFRRSPGSKFTSPLLVNVQKVVLSAAPSAKECIVVAMGRCSYVALCQPDGGDKWITLDAGRGGVIEDVMFAGERTLFVLTRDGSLHICDLRSYRRSTVIATVLPEVHFATRNDFVVRHLVESSGEVMVVFRRYRSGATAFEVFKLLSGPSASWIPVTDLGDRSLFVSTSISESITVADSKDTCLRKNCIYFTRKVNSFQIHGDINVFSMESMTTVCSITISGEYLQGQEVVWVRPCL